MAPSSLLTVISSGLGGGGVARARFLDASSSGVIMSVGLAVAVGVPAPLGVPVVVGAPVPLALPLVLAVALGVLARAPAVTAALPPAFEPLCSWLPLHPLNPEQASNVKASAACRYRLFVEAPSVVPQGLSTLMKL